MVKKKAMSKKLAAAILSLMIAACGCGAAQNSAPAAQADAGAAQADAGAAQADAEAAQADAAASAAGESDTSAAEASATVHIAHRYASKVEGQELLLSNEEYYNGFSQNDLDFKMQKKGAVMEEYKAFAAEQTEDFTEEEMDAADSIFREMEKNSRRERLHTSSPR